jgi:hypothetical protein
MVNIKIPIKLKSEANASEHWIKGHKRHKTHKALVRYFLTGCHKPDTFPINVTLIRHSPRPFDRDDNLRTAFKWIKDEIADFLLGNVYASTGTLKGKRLHGRNDDDERIIWNYRQEKSGVREYFICVQIEQTSPID